MTLSEVRTKYFNYFRAKEHTIIPSAPIIPENDPTTLFTGSGMQPLLPYLLGERHPSGARLANSQRCFRAEDIDEVGDNRHTTFFEMLGNWSLGDYFKEEQLRWFFSFLTDKVGIEPARIFVTTFSGDEAAGIGRDTESEKIWKQLFGEKGIDAKVVDIGTPERGGEVGMQGGQIFSYGSKKNWWSRSGVPSAMPAGEPGGPDSEVFFDFGIPHNPKFGDECHPNCDCGRFMEIGNSVFMEYKKSEDGSFAPLPKRNVDFGGGLERIAAAASGVADVFLAEEIFSLIRQLEEMSGKKYTENPRAFRIVADHIRAAVCMIAEGVSPSNTDRGYIARRLLRRSVRFSDELGVSPGSLSALVLPVANGYSEVMPYLLERRKETEAAIIAEEEKFRRTLAKGMREFEKISAAGSVSARDAFVLFSSYGFPMEMTRELAAEKGMEIDKEAYEKEFEKHRALSRTQSAGKFKGGLADHGDKTTALHSATHLLLAGLRKYLGDGVHQAGSNITPERTRFDFTYGEKVSSDILDTVEAFVNEAIAKRCRVSVETMKKEEARAAGVEGSFWEKYPDKVTVYTVVDDEGTVYSRELCGGPHVENTEALSGRFKIIKEESSSAGVRRIKAVLEAVSNGAQAASDQ